LAGLVYPGRPVGVLALSRELGGYPTVDAVLTAYA